MANRLPEELLCVIGLKLDTTGDRIRFRAVSKSWRSALPFRQPPWLMFSALKDEDEATQLRRFVSVEDEAILTIELPELHQAHVVGSAGNWLITTHLDKTLRLTNPFSKLQLHLPSTFLPPPHFTEMDSSAELPPKKYRDDLLLKVVPSSSDHPANSDTRWVVIMCYPDPHLAVARRGDASWTPVISTSYEAVDVIFYKQMVYAVNDQGRLMVCDIGDGRNPPRSWFLEGLLSAGPCAWVNECTYYLVEWLEELLMVVRMYTDDENGYIFTTSFLIFKVDLENSKFDMLDSLGDHCLFLGYNTSVSLLASDYFGLVRRNCIYFTDYDYARLFKSDPGDDTGVFDVEDNNITFNFEGNSTSLYWSQAWIIPA